MKAELLDRLRKTDQVSRIELGETIDFSFTSQDHRGGHNRKPLDLAQVRTLIVEQGLTAAQLSKKLTINYERAQRLTDITHAIEQGASASQISYRFNIPTVRAQYLMEVLGKENKYGD
jgi:hypothetical protein